MLTSFSQTWALRRCCQETLSPIEISSSFPEKNLFELWNILLGQLRRALEEYLRIQRLVSPGFFSFSALYLITNNMDRMMDFACSICWLWVCSASFFPALFASAHYTNCNFRVWLFVALSQPFVRMNLRPSNICHRMKRKLHSFQTEVSPPTFNSLKALTH